MKFKVIKKIVWLAIIVAMFFGGWYGYKTFFVKPQVLPFKTQRAERRDVFNTVQAEGILEAQGTSKIGSLIQGTIKKILVAENQDVKKGQVLALIDNGFGGDEGDSLVVQQRALCKQAKVTVDYLSSNYKRQEALYKAGQLAQDAFEKVTKDYLFAKADLDNKEAAYKQVSYQFEQTKVIAPHDGTILAIPVKLGELVTPAASTSATLFRLAEDLSTMKAILNVDEGKIGDVKIGQNVNLTVDTYPYQVWKGAIDTIGNEPIVGTSMTDKSVFYKTELTIKDPARLLRPGMTVHAKIKAGKAEHVLTLPGFVFQFPPKALEALAKTINYTCKLLDAAHKKELSKDYKHPHKFVWVVDGKTFIEKAVEVGLSDNAFYEIRAGITDQDNIIFDLVEIDATKELMKKLMGGGL